MRCEAIRGEASPSSLALCVCVSRALKPKKGVEESDVTIDQGRRPQGDDARKPSPLRRRA